MREQLYFNKHNRKVFLFDSGATCHVTNDINWLTNTRRHTSTISIADHSIVQSDTMGDIIIETECNNSTS